ncbi:MAG TPA: hypothetical protein VEY11_08575 [Pyrinomonadaceae bacterium]|nr:hypothetical protein [Pyrinomonadaceae bacterium]
MLRRKLGILFLVGITVLAGTQEAARQFDGLKSSLKNFTRASLWSGLIVYAQPVSDGKLPAPQIYYLMPPPPQQQQPLAPAAQQAVLADNVGAATTAKPDTRNNHGAEVVAASAAMSNAEAAPLVATREVEDAAKSELALNALPLNLVASHLVAPKPAPKPERVRVYEEVAKHEALAARRVREGGAAGRVFVKEFDAEKLVAEAERLVAEQGHHEHLKSKMRGELTDLHRRTEMRIVLRPARTERLERIRVVASFDAPRGKALLETSSVGCEKPRTTPRPAPVPAPPAPVAKRNAHVPAEPGIELELPSASNPTRNSWTLNCDTEPEQQ